MTRVTFRGLVRAVACAALAACSHAAEEGEHEAVATVAASVDTVRPETFEGALEATGTVVVRPGHLAALGAPGPARVSAVPVAVGDRVRAGTVLVELDPAPFEAQAQAAAAALVSATRAHERAQRLVDAGIAPRKDLDLATSDLAQATAAAATARRLRTLATLRAPIDGIVTRVAAALGASVDGTASLVEVADPHAVDIVLAVSADEAAQVVRGARVDLRSGSAAGGASLGAGHVTGIAGAIDTASRSVAVRVTPGTLTRELRIGESVSGRIALAAHAGALLIPQAALVPDGDAFRVFVVDSANVAHARAVEVGARRDGRVEVTNGLQAGDRVVTDGAYQVDEGTHVVLKVAQPPDAARRAPASR